MTAIYRERIVYVIVSDSERRRHGSYYTTAEEGKELADYHTASENVIKDLSLKPAGEQVRTWSTQSSLAWALLRTFGGYYAFIGIFELIYTVLTFIRPPIQR